MEIINHGIIFSETKQGHFWTEKFLDKAKWDLPED
jgi:hypothetical protein